MFENRVALVTGGSRGIGRACCERLAQSHARVVVNYRTNDELAEQVVDSIIGNGGEAISIQADVADETSVAAMIEQIGRHWGPVELLVNNAGIFDVVDHNGTTRELWQRTIDINLTGVYNVIWATKDAMIERSFGRIVNVASIAGLRDRPQSIAYSASKAGVIGMTRSLATALAPHNIRVNAIAPGLIDTDMIAGVDQSLVDNIVGQTPIQRLGTAAEMANLVAFLLSEQSSFTTGQTMVASGGRVQLP